MKPNSYDIKRELGVIFQEVAVFNELTVYENIDYFCGLYIKDKKTRQKYIDEALELVGLEGLNIACGIAHKPKLIFLDEPTVAVDPQSRNNILDGIKKLRDNGAAIIYTTHYMEEVEIICDRIIILDKGKILAMGTSNELKELAKIEEKVTIESQGLEDEQLEKIRKLKHVVDVTYDTNSLVITYQKGDNNLGELIEYLKKENITYNKIYSERPTLNDVFLELTGKELRD